MEVCFQINLNEGAFRIQYRRDSTFIENTNPILTDADGIERIILLKYHAAASSVGQSFKVRPRRGRVGSFRGGAINVGCLQHPCGAMANIARNGGLKIIPKGLDIYRKTPPLHYDAEGIAPFNPLKSSVTTCAAGRMIYECDSFGVGLIFLSQVL